MTRVTVAKREKLCGVFHVFNISQFVELSNLAGVNEVAESPMAITATAMLTVAKLT
jgi:hypothetical protein